jgi:hypothetical protein
VKVLVQLDLNHARKLRSYLLEKDCEVSWLAAVINALGAIEGKDLVTNQLDVDAMVADAEKYHQGHRVLSHVKALANEVKRLRGDR